MTITNQELDEPVKAACEAWADAWDRENAARGIPAKPLREYGTEAWKATEICMREALRAALLSVEQGRGWRPIATAPKETSVLIFSPDASEPQVFQAVKYDGDWWEDKDSMQCICADPTHWRALPPPPEPK